jgi:hypothetical protein
MFIMVDTLPVKAIIAYADFFGIVIQVRVWLARGIISILFPVAFYVAM